MTVCDNLITCVFTLGPSIMEAAFAVIAAASAIAALTPTPKDDHWVAKAYRLIDLMALNIGYAKQEAKTKGGRFVPN